MEFSAKIEGNLDAEVTAWRTRPLQPVWPIVYFDGIVVHVRGANGRVAQHTVYVALGVNLDGHKELLGLWLGENEGAIQHWKTALNHFAILFEERQPKLSDAVPLVGSAVEALAQPSGATDGRHVAGSAPVKSRRAERQLRPR